MSELKISQGPNTGGSIALVARGQSGGGDVVVGDCPLGITHDERKAADFLACVELSGSDPVYQ